MRVTWKMRWVVVFVFLVIICAQKMIIGDMNANPQRSEIHSEFHSALKGSQSKAITVNTDQSSNVRGQDRIPQNPSTIALDEHEEASFLSDVENVFGKLLLAGLDKNAERENLSRLNERGLAGARAIVSKLSKAPAVESEFRGRMAYADYLLYRARFDPETRKIAIDLSREVPSDAIPPKFRGAMFAERGELLGGLVASDFEATRNVLASINHPLMRRVAAAETVMRLAQNGMPIEEARSKIKSIIPDYKM